MSQTITADQILTFWFEDIDPKLWWIKDVEFDTQIKQRFEGVLLQAKRGAFTLANHASRSIS